MARLMADAGPGNASRILSVVPGVNIIAASPGWSQRDWSQFPGGITRLRYTHDPADYTADILDVEPAYAQPGDVPTWLTERQRHGLPPGTVYANVSRIGQVRQAAGNLPFHWWASNQTGQPHAVPGAVATQYYGSRQQGWQGVDISLVSDPNWPGGGATVSGTPSSGTPGGRVPAATPAAVSQPQLPIPPPGFTYQNPLRSLSGLQPARIDMGVDYSGTGPVYPIGPGRVIESDTSWAGGFGAVGPGTFIQYQITQGPLSGYYVYVAENLKSSVHPGQMVTPSTPLGTATGGIETGFGSGKPGLTAAAAAGQQAPSGDPGARPTAYGAAFSSLLAKLGAPPGTNTGGQTPFGVIPQALVAALGALGAGGVPGSGSVFGGLFGGLLAPFTEIGHFFGLLVSGLTDVHMWISLGWLALGMALLIMGFYLWIRTSETYGQAQSAVLRAV